MRSSLNLLTVSLIVASLSACVTTREQMNAEKGIGQGDASSNGGSAAQPESAPSRIQSEDITPHSSAKAESATRASASSDDGTNESSSTKVTKSADGKYITTTTTTTSSSTSDEPASKPQTAPSGDSMKVGSSSDAGNAKIVTHLSDAGKSANSAASSASSSSNSAAGAIAAGAGAGGAAVTSSTPAVAIPQPDVSSYSSDELRAEVARLTGQVEDAEHDKKTTQSQYEEEKKKSENRIAELEKKLKELQPDAPSVPEGKTPFQAGKDDFNDGKYDEAITFLSQDLAKGEPGKETEEATYLRGEAYFKKQQYNKAIVDFSRFPEKFQKSSFHPKALFRIAESFEAMGRKDDAKAFYSDLVDKFPKTAEGKVAKKRLKAKK